jgi:hypothetical protein
MADSNPLWRVTEKVGRDAFRAVCVNEPIEIHGQTLDSDFAGQERTFGGDEIRRSIAMAQVFTSLIERSNDFWSTVEVGATLHYHNSFGKFIRGVVVEQDGKRMLRPTALVGAWSPIDLPKRQPDGSVYESYHAQKIREGDAWQPSDGTIYESPSFAEGHKAKGDPRALPALDLTVPPMTDEEVATAVVVRLARKVRDVLETPDEPALREAARLLREHGYGGE